MGSGSAPTKTMVSSARIAQAARRAPSLAFALGKVRVNMAEIVARARTRWSKSFRSGIEDGWRKQCQSRPSTHGMPRFSGPHGDRGGQGRALASNKIFIDTGDTPDTRPRPSRVPDQPQHHGARRGAGSSHCARRQLYRPRIRPDVPAFRQRGHGGGLERPDRCHARTRKSRQSLKDALEEEGMNFRLGARTTNRSASGVKVTIEKKDGTSETLKGSHLLLCVGQTANSDDLGLDRSRHRDRSGRLHQAQRQTGDQRVRRECWATSKAGPPSPMSRMTTIS